MTAEQIDLNTLRMSWDAFAADLGTATAYNVYQNGAVAQTVTGRSVTVGSLALGTPYQFNITAVVGGVEVRSTLPVQWQQSAFAVASRTVMPERMWWRGTDPPYVR